jgi:hypothetical protein
MIRKPCSSYRPSTSRAEFDENVPVEHPEADCQKHGDEESPAVDAHSRSAQNVEQIILRSLTLQDDWLQPADSTAKGPELPARFVPDLH